MRRSMTPAVFMFAAMALAGACARSVEGQAATESALAAKLQVKRGSPSDLEVGGDVTGVPRGQTRYLPREVLLSISQEMFVTGNDGSFTAPSKITGAPLGLLVRDLAARGADMAVAVCSDKYRSNYPQEYIAAHDPVLVAEVNGKALEDWPRDAEGANRGPYLIAHVSFKPAFKILAHTDEPQIPWGVIRLEFREEKAVFGAIAPRGPRANDALVQDGYKIAEQNCFRCHNQGDEGGQKSGVTWTVLAALAKSSPEFFAEYVRNPKGKNAKTQMAANPEYDGETMRALIAYFRRFTAVDAR